jgi:hypothetical protein
LQAGRGEVIGVAQWEKERGEMWISFVTNFATGNLKEEGVGSHLRIYKGWGTLLSIS